MDAGDNGIGTIVVGLDGSGHAARTSTTGLAGRMDARVWRWWGLPPRAGPH